MMTFRGTAIFPPYSDMFHFKQSREEFYDLKTMLRTFPSTSTTSIPNFMQFGAADRKNSRTYIAGLIFFYIYQPTRPFDSVAQ